ncbi:TetR/AcrR family transcriptional regulator [Solicola sp. PLA-1-18]|uniref:TetR/AcrR family transcriptional regulator n=1 Tax=Solicola sp. PLA-1-18 TaxID=3380532 RepID=UPI003B79C2B0
MPIGSAGADPRRRLLEAMVAALRAGPYDEVTVADVVRRAQVSRRTFYEHFDDRHACLEAVLEESSTAIMATVVEAVDTAAPWQEQVLQAVDAWVSAMRRDPAVTLCWIRVVPALGERGRRFDRVVTGRYAELIRTLVDRPETRAQGLGNVSGATITLLVGGLRELVAVTVEDGGDLDTVAGVAARTFVRVLTPPT